VIALRVDVINGVWICLLALFVNQGARGAVAAGRFSDRIGGVTAGDLMDDEPIAIPEQTTALQAQDEFFARYRAPWLPVVDADGIYMGVLRSERTDGAIAAGQPALAVGELVDDDSASGELQIERDTPLEALLTSEPLRRLGVLAVVGADRRLLGTVSIEQVQRALAASFGQR
jgi:predicted transcriptional regulator